eukprot:Lithocolla_globosa_v1_NODE_5514_length_1228_cov_70.501279.p1 type:complete len:261 gc:universal NODE_5514_length_1228_cov_70.501279:410-1192(+)
MHPKTVTAYLLFSSPTKQLPDTFPCDNLPPNPPQTTQSTTTTKVIKIGDITTKTTTKIDITKITQSITREQTIQTIQTLSPRLKEIETIQTQPYIVTTNSNPLNLTIDGSHIIMEEKTKFLGVMVNENTKWHSHVQMILQKLFKYVRIFSKLRYYCPKKVLISLYYSFIYSNLIYCLEIWGNSETTLTYLQPLLLLQKKLVRIIDFSTYQAHALPIFQKLKILHIFDLYRFRISLLAHKITHNNKNYPSKQHLHNYIIYQ